MFLITAYHFIKAIIKNSHYLRENIVNPILSLELSLEFLLFDKHETSIVLGLLLLLVSMLLLDNTGGFQVAEKVT